MVEPSRRASGGTLAACLAALDEGFAANLAGGTHHAFSDRGEGYCVFNDSAIAVRAIQAAGLVERVELSLPQRGGCPRRATPRRRRRYGVPGDARKRPGSGARRRGCIPRHL